MTIIRSPRLSLAPMLKLTDPNFRRFLRHITRHTLLYTEMIPAQAIALGKRYDLIELTKDEPPIALQLGGNAPKLLATCAQIAENMGYAEVNLNCGCPSDRVAGAGCFGAALIKSPSLVGECVNAMKNAAPSTVISVKTRIGIAPDDELENLVSFIETVKKAGCTNFIIHARGAVLKKLSPKENRRLPKLRPPVVYELKRLFPELEISINGEVESLATAKEHLEKVDGAMIGRAAYQNPWLFAQADKEIFGASENPSTSRLEVVEKMLEENNNSRDFWRHSLGLFFGTNGAKRWRQTVGAAGKTIDTKEIEWLARELMTN